MAPSNFGRPGLFAPRNLIAIGAVVVVVLGGFLLLRTVGGPAPQPPAPEVAKEVEPVSEPPPQEAPPEEPEPEPMYPTVLVATQDIRPGVFVSADLVDWREWIEPLNVELAVVKDLVDIGQVLGAVALQPIAKGQLVSLDLLIQPGHSAFITAALKPGHRAVTIEVDGATTSANVIYPGDRVDVIMVLDGDKFAAVGPAAQVLTKNVRVLAVGSSSLGLGRLSGLRVAGIGTAPTPPEGDTYTLEVTPVDAERLVLGAANGRLTLAMRAIGQAEGQIGRPRLTRLGEVLRLPAGPAKDAEGEPAPPVLPAKVRVIRGGGRTSNAETVAAPSGQPAPSPAETAAGRPA